MNAPDLKGLLAPLEAQMAELQKERDKLTEERTVVNDKFALKIDAVDVEIRRVRRILKAAFPESYPPNPQTKAAAKNAVRKATGKGGGRGIGIERIETVEQFIHDHLEANDTVTQTEARLALGLNSSDVAIAFRLLREGYVDDEGERHPGILRQSGQKGNLKFFKFTKAHEREVSNATT